MLFYKVRKNSAFAVVGYIISLWKMQEKTFYRLSIAGFAAFRVRTNNKDDNIEKRRTNGKDTQRRRYF